MITGLCKDCQFAQDNSTGAQNSWICWAHHQEYVQAPAQCPQYAQRASAAAAAPVPAASAPFGAAPGQAPAPAANAAPPIENLDLGLLNPFSEESAKPAPAGGVNEAMSFDAPRTTVMPADLAAVLMNSQPEPPVSAPPPSPVPQPQIPQPVPSPAPMAWQPAPAPMAPLPPPGAAAVPAENLWSQGGITLEPVESAHAPSQPSAPVLNPGPAPSAAPWMGAGAAAYPPGSAGSAPGVAPGSVPPHTTAPHAPWQNVNPAGLPRGVPVSSAAAAADDDDMSAHLPPGRGKMMIPMAVIVVALGLAGYFFLGKKSSSGDEAGQPSAPSAAAQKAPGPPSPAQAPAEDKPAATLAAAAAPAPEETPAPPAKVEGQDKPAGEAAAPGKEDKDAPEAAGKTGPGSADKPAEPSARAGEPADEPAKTAPRPTGAGKGKPGKKYKGPVYGTPAWIIPVRETDSVDRYEKWVAKFSGLNLQPAYLHGDDYGSVNLEEYDYLIFLGPYATEKEARAAAGGLPKEALKFFTFLKGKKAVVEKLKE
ncbi:MAG: hypothetical protein GMKNLPBB_03144 [Myxococcota bacterium]|nr:hypothetical protein [Myxococcota bacterium]